MKFNGIQQHILPIISLCLVLLAAGMTGSGIQAAPLGAGSGAIHPAGALQSVSEYVDGYGGNVFTAQDNMLHSGAPAVNFGGHDVYDVSAIRKFLQRFNLSAIPAGSQCLSATVYYYKTSTVPNEPVTVTIYSVSQANSNWPEGAQYGGVARPGDSNWNQKDAAGLAWAGSPGLSTAGIDYEPDPIGAFVINANAPAGTRFEASLSCERIRGWFGASNSNYGILLVASGMAEYIGSSEHPNTGYRPHLMVRYNSTLISTPTAATPATATYTPTRAPTTAATRPPTRIPTFTASSTATLTPTRAATQAATAAPSATLAVTNTATQAPTLTLRPRSNRGHYHYLPVVVRH